VRFAQLRLPQLPPAPLIAPVGLEVRLTDGTLVRGTTPPNWPSSCALRMSPAGQMQPI
jgi:hypothetical protein